MEGERGTGRPRKDALAHKRPQGCVGDTVLFAIGLSRDS